jgi:phytoene synthase
MTSRQTSLFKKSSKTFYYSTIFFPDSIKLDIHKLYGFVRTADDYVGSVPQKSVDFYEFKKRALFFIDHPDQISDNEIIASFIEVYHKYDFKREWVESFLWAMESDLGEVMMRNTNDLEKYMYGSAAVVGFMMCAIFSVRDTESLDAAKNLAYSMQLINFIRDIDEDNELWRRYLYDIDDIEYESDVIPDDHLTDFVEKHIQYYRNYLHKSWEWLYNLPLRFRIPVLTASQMYDWTAREIKKNPLMIFEKKLKPSKLRVIITALKNTIIESCKSFISIKK